MVSIIIPTYNDRERLRDCLLALTKQSFPIQDFEVLVVDNNSKQDILSIVKEFGLDNFRYLKEDKVGSYAARNKGLAEAKGEIIAFTDSDCLPQPNWLLEGVACLISAENPGVVGGKIALFFKDRKPNYVEIYEKYTAFRQIENIATGTCVGANWFSYKTVLAELGYFNSKLKSGGDTELSGKIYKKGYRAYYCERALILHPSRHSYKDIGTKYSRIFGGKFDKFTGNKIKFTYIYVCKFIFRRLKWNAKMAGKISLNESFALFIVNLYIFGRLIKEALRLNRGYESERS